MGKILIIDDDQGTTRLLELILSGEGHEVISVNNGDDILRTVSVFSPNLILLDLIMPSPDGFEVFKNVRAESQFARIPIIFFTSVSDIEKKVAAFGLGASDYMVKPIHPKELKARIKALLGKGSNNHQGA